MTFSTTPKKNPRRNPRMRPEIEYPIEPIKRKVSVNPNILHHYLAPLDPVQA